MSHGLDIVKNPFATGPDKKKGCHKAGEQSEYPANPDVFVLFFEPP
jgi:hypothetical protein